MASEQIERIRLELLLRRVGYFHTRQVVFSRISTVAFYGGLTAGLLTIWLGWRMLIVAAGCVIGWLLTALISGAYRQLTRDEIDRHEEQS